MIVKKTGQTIKETYTVQFDDGRVAEVIHEDGYLTSSDPVAIEQVQELIRHNEMFGKRWEKQVLAMLNRNIGMI